MTSSSAIAANIIANSINTSPAALLNEVYGFLGRFVAYPNEAAHVAHVLWVAHAHFIRDFETTPRIAFLSPEPGSGKTRALEITELLVPRPITAVNMSSNALFRLVGHEDGLPTILFDEIDTVFGPKARDNEELRGLLNAGYRRGAKTFRCVMNGKAVDVVEIEAFAAVALAGLGDLPDTILTRSVIVRMRRRAPNEQVEPYRRRLHGSQGEALCNRLAEWAANVDLSDTIPVMPDSIVDRDADVWEALLVVADAAGGSWPDRARASCVSLVTSAKERTPSLGLHLLADLRAIFGEHSVMATDSILLRLHDLDESPWADLRGKPLDPRGLARLLRPYNVGRRQVRIGTSTSKGYARDDLHDAWVRYLPSTPEKSETRVTTVTSIAKPAAENPTAVTPVTLVTQSQKDGEEAEWGGL